MGYRSDVTVLMRKVDYDKMVMDTQTKPEYAVLASYVDAIDDVQEYAGWEDKRYMKLEWYDIKWYDSAVEDYLRGLGDTYWELWRLGEDFDDTEYEYNVPEDEELKLSCKRVIDLDYSELSPLS